MIESLIPNHVKVKVTSEDFRVRTNLTFGDRIAALQDYHAFFFPHYIRLYQGLHNGFIQKKPGNYKSEQPNNITEIDKAYLKSDCVIKSTLNGILELISFSFASIRTHGHKENKTYFYIVFKIK